MHVLVAPDKFKGSLTAGEVAAAVTAGMRRVSPHLEVVALPVADGGDGTLDAAVAAGYERVPVSVRGPVGDVVLSAYAVRDGIAVVELADACGLQRMPGNDRAPLTASSAGLGEVVAAALDAGCHRIVIGVGGSASTDGGVGMLAALGAVFTDADARPTGHGGAALSRLTDVDLRGLHRGLARAELVLAGDVDNALLGEHGAAAVYGPQKGASPDEVRRLDDALARLCTVLDAAGVPASLTARTPGAGAAGGVGFAAMAVLGATMRPGIDVMLGLVGFADRLTGSTLVVTGEGSLDAQTLHGKAPAGVAAAAATRAVRVVAVAGRCLLSPAQLAAVGISRAYALSAIEPDPALSMRNARPLLETLAGRVAQDWLSRPGSGA